MAQLSTPKNFIPPVDNIAEITRLLEEQLSANREFDKTDNSSYNFKRVTITGHFEPEDCREVCRRYKDIGWEEVRYRTVPHYGFGEKQTTFTFRVPKSK